ncbi:MAG: Sinorhizobium phage phiM7 [Bacteroidota bacterium]|jgi:hypothetical protein
MKDFSLRDQITTLFSEGKTVYEIKTILKCPKSRILYYTDTKYKEALLERRRISKKKARSLKKKQAIDLFGGKCQICCYNKSQSGLTFHHVDSKTKNFEISNAQYKDSKTEEEIIEELKKCILVCCNCHAEIHAGITKIPENVKNPLLIENQEKVENPLTIDQNAVN